MTVLKENKVPLSWNSEEEEEVEEGLVRCMTWTWPPASNKRRKTKRRKPWRHKLSDLSAGRQVTGSYFVIHDHFFRQQTDNTHARCLVGKAIKFRWRGKRGGITLSWAESREACNAQVTSLSSHLRIRKVKSMTLTSNLSRARRRNGEEEVRRMEREEEEEKVNNKRSSQLVVC